MKTVFRFAVLACGLSLGLASAFAQGYSLTSADFPTVGVNSTFETDTTVQVNVGSAGANQNWDFTQSLKGKKISYQYLNPGSALYGQSFVTSSNLAVQFPQWLSLNFSGIKMQDYYDGAYFEKFKSDTLFGVGMSAVLPIYAGPSPFTTISVFYPFPMAIGKKWLKYYIAPFKIYTIISAAIHDSIWIEADAAGKLTLPMGTLDVLRLKQNRFLSLKTLSGSTWQTQYQGTFIVYEWYTQKAGLVLQVISHDGEKSDNFTEAGYVARLYSTTASITVGCGPECRPTDRVPTGCALEQNYPNPFNPSTRIPYTLQTPAYVDIRVYTLLGLEVAVLESGLQTAGRHEAFWSGRDQKGAACPGALYFCRMKATPVSGAQAVVQTRKMLLTD